MFATIVCNPSHLCFSSSRAPLAILSSYLQDSVGGRLHSYGLSLSANNKKQVGGTGSTKFPGARSLFGTPCDYELYKDSTGHSRHRRPLALGGYRFQFLGPIGLVLLQSDFPSVLVLISSSAATPMVIRFLLRTFSKSSSLW